MDDGRTRNAMPYTRYTRADWVEVSTPTISDIDRSSATHCGRVISEPAITIAKKTTDAASRRMSLVRRVSGCSKLPETLMSRPSTRMSRPFGVLSIGPQRWRPADNITAYLGVGAHKPGGQVAHMRR